MPRFTLIAALSLAVNALGWGLFGYLLGPGAEPADVSPVEVSLAPAPPPETPRALPEPPPMEPPRLRPTPLADCTTAARLVRKQPTDSPRPEPPRPPEPPRADPAPAPPESPSAASEARPALPNSGQGTHPQAGAEQPAQASSTATPATIAPAPAPAPLSPGSSEPSLDRSAIAGRIFAAIHRHRRYPLTARRQGLEGTVLLSFQVTRQGAADDVKILRSAGAILDEAALETLKRACPLPYYPGPIRVPVVFSLDD